MSLDLLSFPLVLPVSSASAPPPFSVGDPQGPVFSSPFCTIPTIPEHSHSPPPMASDPTGAGFSNPGFSTELQHGSSVTLSSSNPQIQKLLFSSQISTSFYVLLTSISQDTHIRNLSVIPSSSFFSCPTDHPLLLPLPFKNLSN